MKIFLSRNKRGYIRFIQQKIYHDQLNIDYQIKQGVVPDDILYRSIKRLKAIQNEIISGKKMKIT